MSRPDNIFHNIIRDENSTTELFCNLMKYKLFRDGFLSSFLTENVDDLSFDIFDTQKRSEQGQPDIEISNELIKIIIEVKINKGTQLTENQPRGYIEDLMKSNQKIKWMIFLVPKDYKHVNEIKNNIDESLINNPSTFNYRIINWEDIISIIESNELDKLNPIFSEFVSLLKDWYISKPIRFEWREIMYLFTDEIPKELKKLKDLVDQVIKKTMLPSITYQWSRTEGLKEYGVYFKNSKNQEVLFFGIWLEFWEYKKKPLCFGVKSSKYPKEVIDYFKSKYSAKIETFNDWAVSWFDENIVSDRDNNVTKIQQELEELLENMENLQRNKTQS